MENLGLGKANFRADRVWRWLHPEPEREARVRQGPVITRSGITREGPRDRGREGKKRGSRKNPFSVASRKPRWNCKESPRLIDAAAARRHPRLESAISVEPNEPYAAPPLFFSPSVSQTNLFLMPCTRITTTERSEKINYPSLRNFDFHAPPKIR